MKSRGQVIWLNSCETCHFDHEPIPLTLEKEYEIPKEHPLVANFVIAMRDEEILRREFSYIPPEISRFENRFLGLNNGNSLMAMMLRMNFSVPHNKRYSPKKIEYTGPYTDVRLEPDYNSKNALLCDLTFWAVEFLYLVDN